MATEFGKEISCTSQLKPGRYVTGVRVVAEAAFRRLTTPRGVLRGGENEESYGLDLTEVVGSLLSSDIVASLPGKIQNELLKDERIETVDVTIVPFTEGAVTTLTVTVECQTAEGPFSLQVGASDVSVELLSLNTEDA